MIIVTEIERGGQACRIRPAVLSDILPVYEIEAAVFGEDKFDVLLLRDLIAHSLLFMVLEELSTGTIVGFCILLEMDLQEAHQSTDDDPEAGLAVHIVNVALNDSFRNRGWGKILVQYCLDEVYRRGFSRAQLEVNVANTTAINLYQRLGFRLIKQLPNYYQSGADAFRMEKSIHSPRDIENA